MSFLSSGRTREIFTQPGDGNIRWVGAVGRSVDVILIEEKGRSSGCLEELCQTLPTELIDWNTYKEEDEVILKRLQEQLSYWCEGTTVLAI